jgi:ribosomal protein L40E
MAENTEQSIVGNDVFCAHCGTKNGKDGYACERCGERLIQVTTDSGSPLGLLSCARCGGANNSQAAYCWVCGSDMNDAVRISSAPRSLQNEQTQVPDRPQSPTQAPPKTRTYRPDLNPVSTPSNGPPHDSLDDHSDLRSQAPHGQPQAHSDVDMQQPESPFGSSDGEASENTSGIRDGEIPAGVKRWNWAAFLMPAVWGLFSGVPYTVLLFGAPLLDLYFPPWVQIVVVVVASIYLGAKGNGHAWRGKKWRSVEHFNAFQKQWASWAVKLTIAVGAILVFWVISRGGA